MLTYARTIDRFARRELEAPHLLDVGCGSGKFLWAYSRINQAALLHGLEIDSLFGKLRFGGNLLMIGRKLDRCG